MDASHDRGDVITRGGETEEILFENIDLRVIQEVRTQIPTLNQKRYDVYGSVCGVATATK